MEKRFILLVVLICAINSPTAMAQTTVNGGRGLLRIFSAEAVEGSSFHVNSYFQSYFRNDKPQSGSLSKDYTLSFGMTYLLGKRTELTARLVAYQSDQQHVWGPPGDTELGIKYQTPLSTNNVLTGVRTFLIFPTAGRHNVPYEPYSSGKLALGAQALLTLDFTESFPIVPLKFYANLGYIDRNVRNILLRNNDDQLLLGAGIKFPISTIVFFTEYSAEIFTHLKSLSYSDNASRLTQGASFLGPWNLALNVAVDFDLSSSRNVPGIFYAKDYADWKITIGVHHQFWRYKKPRPDKPALSDKKAQSMQNELEEIKAQRQRARLDIDRMNEALEEEPAPQDESQEQKPPK